MAFQRINLLEEKDDSNSSINNIQEMKNQITSIFAELSEIKLDLENLHEKINEISWSLEGTRPLQPLKPTLKRVTFLENAFTLDELIKFKIECKNRVYEAIYNARGPRSVVSPAYVDENLIEKLPMRDKVRIYIPGKSQPIQVVDEVVTAMFKISSNTYTMPAVLHRDRSIPIVLGKDFGQKFIIGINLECKVLTLQDDNGKLAAITFDFYPDNNANR